MAEHCDFAEAKDDCIRDRLVVGVLDKNLSKQLQFKENLTLAESIKIVQQSEIIKEQLSSQNDGGKSLEEVRKRSLAEIDVFMQTERLIVIQGKKLRSRSRANIVEYSMVLHVLPRMSSAINVVNLVIMQDAVKLKL